MPEYYKQIESDLFDFASYYDYVVERLPKVSRVAELGVANGKSAMFLLEAILEAGKKVDRFLMIDNLEYGRGDQASMIINHLVKSGLGQHVEFMQMDSLSASLKFPDQYFDFVFIDTGHTFELTKAELRLWARKMKHTGILAGHDTHLAEVRQALIEVAGDDGFAEFVTCNGWGVWEIKGRPISVVK